MKLTYWVSEDERLDGRKCYNIRAKTKKECQHIADQQNEGGKDHGVRYGKAHKIVVEYADAFDLVSMALGEGSIFEGERA